jgi:hypothetical protein
VQAIILENNSDLTIGERDVHLFVERGNILYKKYVG